MPPKVQRGIAATILSLIGSSVVLGLITFFLKDTFDKINDTFNTAMETQIIIATEFAKTNNRVDSLEKTCKEDRKIIDNCKEHLIIHKYKKGNK